jgi:acetyl esterase/lipase
MSRLAGLVLAAVHAGAAASSPSVATDDTFNVSMVTGIVYGQGLIFVGTPHQRVVNLTLDAFVPIERQGGLPVPRSPRPAIMFVHGGGFQGSILDPDKAAHLTPDVEFFVQRGFVGFQLNYRLAEDKASFPEMWPSFPPTGGAELGLQPPINAGLSLFESQQFKLANGEGNLLSLASDSELCANAGAPGGAVSMKPCPKVGEGAGTNNTVHWRVGEESIIGVGGAFDGQCLGTQAPSVAKRAFVARVARRCNSSDPSQRWRTHGVGGAGGGTICHPDSSESVSDTGCLSFAGGFNPPVANLYPAVRDVKAAVRWLRASGASQFNVDPAFVTLDGGSAGACTILGAGIAQDAGDFKVEISLADDPTLASTHLAESSAVRSMIVHWGAPFAVDIATVADPLHHSRYHRDPGSLPSIIAYNGLVDTTIPIEHIRAVQRAYEEVNATIVVRPLPNEPHACWGANVTVDGVVVTQSADAFEFIRREQELQPIGA